MPDEDRPYPFHCKNCGEEIEKNQIGTWFHTEAGDQPCKGLIATLDFCDASDPLFEDEVCRCPNHE